MAQGQDWGARALAELESLPEPSRGLNETLDAIANPKAALAADVMAADERNVQWGHRALAELEGLQEPGFGQQALAAGQGLVSGLAGAAKSVFSDFPQSVGLGIAQTLTGRDDLEAGTGNPAAWIGRKAEKIQGAMTPENPLLAGGAAFHYGNTIGQVAPALALAFLGPVEAGVIGATQSGGQTGADAMAGGASGLGLLGATGSGYIAGGALAGGVGEAIQAIAVRGGGALWNVLGHAAAGAGTGVAYTALTNGIHNWATDDELDLLQGAGEAAGVGTALGALSSIVARAAHDAASKRQQTQRRMTGNGWDGAMLPEGVDLVGMRDPEHPLVEAERIARSAWEAEIEGRELAKKNARLYENPAPPATAEELARRPRSGTASQIETDTTGIRTAPDESSPESLLVAPQRDAIRVGKTRDVMVLPKQMSEPGMEVPRDESVVYAPTSRPDYSALNPVTDAEGRTLVSDPGTPTNPSTGLRVTLEDTTGTRGTILRVDAVGAIERAGQQIKSFAIRTGLVPQGYSGLYDETTHEARVAKYGDIRAAAHETFHHIWTSVFGQDYAPDRAPTWKQIEPELEALGRRLYPTTTPNGGHVGEGFAEFGHLWTNQHEDLLRLAPHTTDWFDRTLLEAEPEFKKALVSARGAVDQWRFQGALKRSQPVDPTSWSVRFRRATIGQNWQQFKERWFEVGNALYKLNQAALDAGTIFKPGKSAVEVFNALRGTGDGVLNRFLTHQTFDRARQYTGDPLQVVTDQIRGQRKEFNNYLGLRAQQWRNETKTRFDAETGQRVIAGESIPTSSVDLAYGLARLETKYPHFRAASDQALAWYDRVLAYVAQFDPVLADAIKAMREDGEFYMPLHRWADWYESTQRSGGGASKRAAAQGKLGERTQGGSTREVLDPLTGLIVEARKMIERAHQRSVLNAVRENATEAGLVSMVSDVTRLYTGKSSEGPFGPGEKYGMPDAAQAAMHMLSMGTIDDPNGPIEPFRVATTLPDGTQGFETRYYQFDSALHKAVLSSDPENVVRALTWIGKTLRFSKNVFVLGAVGVNPAFLLLKNPVRDAQTLYVNSRNNPHLVTLIPQLAYEHSRVIAHQISAGHIPYKWVDVYKDLGLDRAEFGATYRSAGSIAKKMTAGPVRRVVEVVNPKAWADVFAHVLGVTERGTRIWELKHTAARVGWKPGETMTPEQAVAMAIDAKQSTVDFSAGGSAAMQVNQIVPFFNVAIQGPRAFVRGVKEHPVGASLALANMTALNLALWWKHKDEDWMQAMPADERMRGFYFPMEGKDGEKILARVPISPEVALPVKAAEFFMDALYSQHPYTAGQYAAAVLENVMPSGVNPLIDEGLRQGFNRQRMFSDAPLVPESLADKPPEQQFTSKTGPLAMWVGQTFKLSPVRAESMLRNFLGTGAPDLFGLLARRDGRPLEAADTTLFGALSRRGGPVSMQNRNVTNLFALAEIANMNAKSKLDHDSVLLRMSLNEATKTVSTATAILNSTSKLSVKERQALQAVVNQAALEAVQQATGEKKVDPAPLMRTRVQLQSQARAAKLAVGGEQ